LPAPTTPSGPSGALITVTDNRLKRTILTLLLPGGVTTRPMQDCLEAAFDHSPSVGFLSELINEAGRRAGEILDKIDFSPLGDVILARDETFFDDFAFLLSVEPRCQVIVSGYVEEGCDAERWGVALQIDHRTRGMRIVGLAEDAARYYPASLEEAELSVPIQKDVWHPWLKPSKRWSTWSAWPSKHWNGPKSWKSLYMNSRGMIAGSRPGSKRRIRPKLW